MLNAKEGQLEQPAALLYLITAKDSGGRCCGSSIVAVLKKGKLNTFSYEGVKLYGENEGACFSWQERY
jgi:hypothetical protein